MEPIKVGAVIYLNEEVFQYHKLLEDFRVNSNSIVSCTVEDELISKIDRLKASKEQVKAKPDFPALKFNIAI